MLCAKITGVVGFFGFVFSPFGLLIIGSAYFKSNPVLRIIFFQFSVSVKHFETIQLTNRCFPVFITEVR